MDIRNIEKIIDTFHEKHPAFTGTKQQMAYDLLATFEDLCSLAIIGSMLNPFSLKKITDYMDALNQALNWVHNSSLSSSEVPINSRIEESRYENCASLINDYALPYSVICSGYISYSRKRLTASVEENNVTFDFPENGNKSAWNDILRETSQMGIKGFMEVVNPIKISSAYEKLKERISIQDEELCYELTREVIDAFSEIASKQWEVTKTLPSSWKFDLFSLEEYRKVWIALATLSYIHLFSSLTIQDALIRLKNSTIIQPMDNIISYVESMTSIDKNVIKNILEYITFEPEKKNVDIMYQPIVVMPGSIMVITPILFVGSRPERNLLSVVSSKTDFEHSKEVNDLENLMVEEIEEKLKNHSNLVIVKHRNLEGRLPDIDLGVYEPNSNAVLLCELKWFMAADSSKEVYAREDDITHGCEQSSQIMAYAMKDKKTFILSCFMVCDSMEVTTRRIRERFECDEALHISIEGYESLFVISDSNKKEPGTDTILTLRPVHPWDRMNEEEFMQCIKGIVPNPAVQIEIETNKGSELYSSDYFDDLDLKPLLDYSWNNIKNIRKIDIDLTCEEYGFKGKGCIGILIKNGLPAEEIEILSKDVEIDGEIYTLSSNIKYKTNCITETSTSISVDEDGEIDTNTSWSERFKSKASLSIHGIEVPYNLFPDYSNGMSKAVLKIPFPFSFRLDIGVNSDLNLNSARDQIIYDEKWLTFEENLYRIICRRLKDTLSSSDWKILNEIIQKNNTDTFSRVANSFE